jgi:pyrimidine-nucleoside phosphorylase
MSKKIAGGANGVLLDVKIGSGAFMHNLHDARELAELMVAIGEGSGRRAVALLSDMSQPLGSAVGNALELREAIRTLHNEGPEDFKKHCLVVAAHMLALGGIASNPEHGQEVAEGAILSGSAWEKFKNLVAAQGGDVSFVEQPDQLPQARYQEVISAPKAGYLSQVDAQHVGQTAVILGAGREKKGDPIDHAVGIEVLHKVGDNVEVGEGVFKVHANQKAILAEAQRMLISGLEFSESPVDPLPLHYGVIGG